MRKPAYVWKKSVPGSFNDQKLIDDYVTSGKYPKIHDGMIDMIRKHSTVGSAPACDFGSCIGLLAVRLVHELNRQSCLAIEGNVHDFARAVRDKKVKHVNRYITPEHVLSIMDLIASEGVKLVTARRVFPEIEIQNGLEFMYFLSAKLYDAGVQEIVLEGRAKTKNPSALLHSALLEADCFSNHYDIVAEEKNIIFLRAKKILSVQNMFNNL